MNHQMEESLGNTLRAARDAKGITVDDAVYLAKIPRAVVKALEAEDFGFFSSPLYARSFLQQYGEYVGADVEPWLNDLEPTTMIDGEATESFIDISEPVAAAVVRERPKKNASGGAWAALWGIVISAATIGGGFKIYEIFESQFSTQTAAEEAKPGQVTTNIAQSTVARDDASEEAIAPEETENQPDPPRRAIIVRE